ncbi:MDR/zinc-dependent alcohol dehydrogenase-like family protein [Paracoccus beibuensis]|uniref:hypothetical protein n=1 Tax=Paracoccus beibuensis TaxID=547602 RepID=UPI002240C0F1|nr:hypothetical protein [Paracoccus beibuensis]
MSVHLQITPPANFHQVRDTTPSGPVRPRVTIVVHGALSPQPTPFPLKVALRHNLSLRGYVYSEVTGNPEVLARAARFAAEAIAASILMPRIDRVFPLDRIVDANR